MAEKAKGSVTIPDSVVGRIGNGAFSGCTALTSINFNGDIRAGFLIQMDGYWWRVLDVQGGKALVISEDVLDERPYHKYNEDITWTECHLRAYLNGEFYNSLSADIKARIVETQVVNDDNLEYGTPGGADTTDKIFLLSIEEAERYFADDNARIAYTIDGSRRLDWWLRSPGYYRDNAACVSYDGRIDVYGEEANYYGNSKVRPAFWINL
jgi:hypothetical protein